VFTVGLWVRLPDLEGVIRLTLLVTRTQKPTYESKNPGKDKKIPIF